MFMFENKEINGIHATRFIVSWLKKGGELRYRKDIDDFYNWLMSLGLSENDAIYIKKLATNGKLELQTSAMQYLKNKHQ